MKYKLRIHNGMFVMYEREEIVAFSDDFLTIMGAFMLVRDGNPKSSNTVAN